MEGRIEEIISEEEEGKETMKEGGGEGEGSIVKERGNAEILNYVSA